MTLSHAADLRVVASRICHVAAFEEDVCHRATPLYWEEAPLQRARMLP